MISDKLPSYDKKSYEAGVDRVLAILGDMMSKEQKETYTPQAFKNLAMREFKMLQSMGELFDDR